MAHNRILVWPDGPTPPILARRLATLRDKDKKLFIRFEAGGVVHLAPEAAVTRLDRLFPDMTGAEISPEIGTA